MGRLWLPATLIGIGIASLLLAPIVQPCITWSDGRACESGWTIVLNVLGGLLIVSGVVWFGLHMMRRAG